MAENLVSYFTNSGNEWVCLWQKFPYFLSYWGVFGLHINFRLYIYIYIKIGRSTKRFVFFESIYFVLIYLLYMCMFPACSFRQSTYVAQGLVNGELMRFELTLVCSWMFFSWLGWVLYRGYSPFFLECVYLSLLYPSLIFDTFIVCVRARWSAFGFHEQLFSSVGVWESVSWGFFACGAVWF